MKINKIAIALIFGFLFQSCLFHEEDVFDKPAYERLTEAVQFNLENFQNAPNGWEIRYFPTNSQTGYTLLAKFDDNEFVTMMGRNTTTGNRDSVATSRYRVRPAEGAVLSFDTENPIIHAFSDPSRPPAGRGFEGDFEFVVIHATEDFVQMRGLKRSTNIEMHRMPEGKNWSQHFDELAAMRTYLLGINPMLTLNMPNASFFLTAGNTGIFRAQPVDNETISMSIPFIITADGLALSRAFVAGGNSVQRFTLNEDRTRLIAINTNAAANIRIAPAADVFLNTVNTVGSRYLVFRNNDENMSASVKTAYTMVETQTIAFSRTLEHIGFANNRDLGPSLTVLTRGAGLNAEGFLGFDMSKTNANEVSLAFSNKFDTQPNGGSNGLNYYNNYNVSHLVALLNGNYTVSFQDDWLFAPSIFRFVCNEDPNKWFNLFFR